MKILKFETTHCPQCKLLDRELAKISNITVEHINAEDNDALVDKYNIGSVPVLIVLDDSGNEITRSAGFINETNIRKLLER